MEKLKATVESVEEYFKEPEKYDLESLITTVVSPVLEGVLIDLSHQIEERHRVDESEIGNDKCLIHYTSIATLISMLQDVSNCNKESSLRMYDTVHSNDPDEGNYLIQALLQDFKWLGKNDMRHAYVASFILPDNEQDLSDNLVFWRTYGKEGEGCSLSLLPPRSGLHKVFYGQDEKCVKHTVKDLHSVLELLNPIVGNDNSSRESIQKKLGETVLKSLERIRYLYKSEAYKFENECRIVILESDIDDKNKISLEYHEQNNSPACMRHYYEHKDLQVKKILGSGSSGTLGPCVPYRDNVSNCIKILRERANLHSPEIKYSKILYRKS